MLVVAQTCGSVDTFKIGDSSVIINAIYKNILQVGTIFKTINTVESQIVFCTDEGLQFAEIQGQDLSFVLRPHMALFPDKMIRAGSKTT